MANKKISRKELVKGTDEFLTLSSRGVLFFKAHLRLFKYLGCAIALVAVIYLGINTYMRYINKKGQNVYNVAYNALSENMRPDADPEGLKRSEELFEKVIDDYGFSKAARLALPQVAYLKFAGSKYDEAIALYKKFSKETPGDGDFTSLTNLALAACYEAKGDLKKATDILNAILDRPTDPFRETVMLSLARLYRLNGQPDKARGILKEFVEEFKTSPFLPMAKARL